jgi:hypothetical protein
VVGQINILSAYTHGEPGKVPAPRLIKQRRPALGHEKRSMRSCRDTGQALPPVAWRPPQQLPLWPQEAAAL